MSSDYRYLLSECALGRQLIIWSGTGDKLGHYDLASGDVINYQPSNEQLLADAVARWILVNGPTGAKRTAEIDEPETSLSVPRRRSDDLDEWDRLPRVEDLVAQDAAGLRKLFRRRRVAS